MKFMSGFQYFPGYLTAKQQLEMIGEINDVIATAPLYVPAMPRTGKLLSVRMTNCGSLGWLTDKDGGYRYQPAHPLTGKPWPPIPLPWIDLWTRISLCPALPEACLINLYSATAKLGSHRDEDEADRSAPVVSVSLGDDAVFHIGGLKRTDPKIRLKLRSGDVVVLGGGARLAYHGVDRVIGGTSDLVPGGGRINLTLRRVTLRQPD